MSPCDLSRCGKQRVALMLAIGALLLILVLPSCDWNPSEATPVALIVTPNDAPTPTPPPTRMPTLTPAPAVHPEDTVSLEVVDVSQVSVTLPIHNRPLVMACESSSYGRPDTPFEFESDPEQQHDVICDIGLLDVENARLIRLRRLTERTCWGWARVGRLAWSPDGTQFAYSSGCDWWSGGDFTVFRADGSSERYIGCFYYGYGFWSSDGNYFFAHRGPGNSLTPAFGYIVYDAQSWSEVCDIGGFWPNIQSRPCELILANGDVLRLEVDGGYGSGTSNTDPHIDLSVICNNGEDCSPQSDYERHYRIPYADPVCSYPSEFDGHQATIENYWLRIIDMETNAEATYMIPDYRITNFVWPND